MSKIKINFNEAVEQISNKLGVASTEIVKEYTGYVKIQAARSFVQGILLCISPWFLLYLNFETILSGSSESFFGYWVLTILRASAILSLSITGAWHSLNSVEDFLQPRAEAISRLLEDISNMF